MAEDNRLRFADHFWSVFWENTCTCKDDGSDYEGGELIGIETKEDAEMIAEQYAEFNVCILPPLPARLAGNSTPKEHEPIDESELPF